MGRIYQAHSWRKTSLDFLWAALAMTLFEGLKELSPTPLSLWESHAITILAAGVIATVGMRRIDDTQRREYQFRKALLQTIPDPVWMKDPKGLYLACNQAFEISLGRTEAEILGKSDDDFMTPEHAASYRARDQAAVMAGKPTVNEEWITYAKATHPILLQTTKTPLYGVHGELIGVLGISHDITDLRLQQEALRASQATLRTAQEMAHVGSWKLDPISGAWDCSEACLRILGVPAGGGMDQERYLILVHGEDRAAVRNALETVRMGGECDLEHRILVEGVLQWVRFQALWERDVEGGPGCLIGVIHEITQRKRLEASLSENLARSLAIIEASPVAMAINDDAGNITYINSAGIWTFGYTLRDIPTLEAWWPLAYPDPAYRRQVATAWQEHLDRARETGEPFKPMEVRIHCKDGTCRDVLVQASSLAEAHAGIHLVTLMDITERKQAEDALRESQERYRALFESAPDAIFLADASTGIIVDANREAEQLLGRPLSEVIGMHQSQLHPPGMLEETTSAFKKHVALRIVDAGSATMVDVLRGDGTMVPVEISGCTVTIEGRAFVQGIFRNISQRLSLEHTIATKDAEYRRMIENLQDGYWSVDTTNGTIQDVNEAYVRLSGYSRAELIGKHISELDAIENATDAMRRIERMMPARGSRFETWHRTKQGQIWPVEITTTFSPLPGGVNVAFARDISQRKRDEATILREKETHQQLAQLGKELLEARNSSYGSLCRAVLNCCKIITQSSHGYINLVDSRRGWSRNYVLDAPFVLPRDVGGDPPLLKGYHDPWGWVIGNRQPLVRNTPTEDARFFDQPVPPFRFERFLAIPVLREGRVIAEVAVANANQAYGPESMADLVWVGDLFAIALERFELERQLQHAQKMEAIGTLSAGIAHDFNNILGIMLGFTELAQLRLDDRERVRQSLDGILIAGSRAKGLVDQLLTFSRDKGGEKGVVQLATIVKEVKRLLQHTVPQTVTLEIDIRNPEVTVMGDPTQLHQLLLNLCTNAIQALNDARGRIDITLERVLPVGEAGRNLGLAAGAYARLQVSDNGAGIPQEILEHIFEPFFTTKGVGKGTGLGLSVVHGIVTGHGGAIHVESRMGQGSLFSVYLPVAGEVREFLSEGTHSAAEPQPSLHGKLLIVDDEAQLLTIQEQMLVGAGFDVVCCTSPDQALARYADQPDHYVALITDNAMPGMTGIELASRIKAHGTHLPVVLCTGMGDGGHWGSSPPDHVDIVLQKPTPLRKLLEVLSELLPAHGGVGC
ncbi:MAG: PAS domain S-box protein [Magnetococcales bacterium]|nr:PAS domain S-box protein [Magnetococcales bacterium]